MLPTILGDKAKPLSILCLGAHCDDIEIGCGRTVLRLLAERPGSTVTWLALASNAAREWEARGSEAVVVEGAASADIMVERFRDGYFPSQFSDIKELFETTKGRVKPDLILTHHRH